MINAIERLSIMERELARMNARGKPWQQNLIEVANAVRLGRSDEAGARDDITCIFLHNLSMLDHPSEWMGDHRYEASSYVDQLHSLLMFGADPNARLSNGRNVLDVLTAEGRYWRWKDANENIPDLVLAASSFGALVSADAAKAMILPVYQNIHADHIDMESALVCSRIDLLHLDRSTSSPSGQASAKRL
jgi:hypothetical protein